MYTFGKYDLPLPGYSATQPTPQSFHNLRTTQPWIRWGPEAMQPWGSKSETSQINLGISFPLWAIHRTHNQPQIERIIKLDISKVQSLHFTDERVFYPYDNSARQSRKNSLSHTLDNNVSKRETNTPNSAKA